MNKICPSCGNKAPEQFRFCGFCGESLEAEPTAVQSILEDHPTGRTSRRLATVLFADLTNSTGVAEKIDPENVFLTVRDVLESLARPVKRLGGFIDRYVGDGFLARFGVPEAHEDDPYRALLAAIEMQEMMGEMARRARASLGWDVSLRIGLNMGPVISGQLDTGSGFDWSVFGHTVNLASRLQGAARPGTILVSESIYRHTRGAFEFYSPAKLQLKGIDQPVVGYELAGKRESPDSIRGLTGRSTPKVGRNKEYNLLVSSLQKVRLEGQGMVALITGEAGIGKSRLVDDVSIPLIKDFKIVQTQSSSYEMPSYSLLSDIIESLAGISPSDSVSYRLDLINDLLSGAGELSREIGETLSELVTERTSSEIVWGDPIQHQRKIYVAVRRLFTWLTRRQPIMLVLDDLQWADASSLDVLSHISDLIHETPLAMIAVSRTPIFETLPDFLTEVREAHPSSFVDVRLTPLSSDETEHLVSLLLKELTLPVEFKRTVYDRTKGNPLLMEELVRMLLDEGVIYEDQDGWHLDSQWKHVIQLVPETVNGLMLARYDRQAPDLKKLLDIASVLGVRFPFMLLDSISELNETELRSQLNELEQADFIRRSSGAITSQYSFRHPLMQETIYETILQEEVRSFHQRAAEAIQQLSQDYFFNSAALIGYHLEKANSPEASIYLLQAAREAQRRYANQEAVAYYYRVETLLSQNDASRSVAGVEVALGLGTLFARAGKLEEALAQLKRARELSMELPNPGHGLGEIYYQLGLVFSDQRDYVESVASFEMAATLLRDNPDRDRTFTAADIERELGWVMCYQGKLDEGASRAENALSIAKDESDLASASSAYNLLAAIHYWNGQLTDSVEIARKSLEIREKMGDLWGAASSQNTLGIVYHKLGQWSQAESLFRQAIFVQQEIGDFQTLSGTWSNLGMLLLDSGRLDEALHCMNQAIQTLPPDERGAASAYVLYLNRGFVWLRLGQIDQAIADFEKAAEGAKAAKNDDLLHLAIVYKAEGQLNRREYTLAWKNFYKAEELSADGGSPETQAEIQRVKSLLLLSEQNWKGALDANFQAQDLYRQLGSRYEVARLQLDAAEIALGQGDDIQDLSQIKRDLVSALDVFRQLQAQADIPRAEELLDKLNEFLDTDEQVKPLRPVVVVNLTAEIPDLTSSEAQDQENYARALRRINKDLQKIAHSHNLVSVNKQTGWAFLASGSSSGDFDRLALKAINSAQAAIDVTRRHNRTFQKQLGIHIPVGMGIAVGQSQELIGGPDQAAIFANVSQIGRKAEAAANLASDNQILITGNIPSTIQSLYELQEIDSVGDRRLSEQVFRVLRAKPEMQLPRTLPGSSPKLVGRKTELEVLKDWIVQVREDSTGRVCYLEAEAGMGKTRLLEDVLEYAQRGVQCLVGKCESFRANISFWPLIDMLDRANIPDSDVRRQLEGLLGLSPLNERDEVLVHTLSSTSLRDELYGRIRSFLTHQAEEKPVLLVVEDIHWLDLSTLDLIDHLISLVLEAPVSLMLVARSEMPGPHRALVDKAERVCRERFMGINFSELTRDEDLQLVGALLGSEKLPAGLVNLLEPFLGHPLSIEEALRFLIERNWLWQIDGEWILKEIDQSLTKGLPTTFKDLLFGRLDMLENETMHVMQAAAVLGETFDRAILNRMIPGSGLLGRLSELIERGWLLAEDPESPQIYRFKHTLTRETIYSTLFRSKKQLLHQRAGEAIEELYPESQDMYAELIAHHFGNSSLQEKSLHYLLKAAEKSSTRHALTESLSYYQWAKEIIKSSQRPKTNLMIKVRLGLADVYLNQGEPARARKEVSPLLDGSYADPTNVIRVAALRRTAEADHKMGNLEMALDNYKLALSKLEETKNLHEAISSKADASRENENIIIQLGIAQVYFDMRKNQVAAEQIEYVVDGIDKQRHPEKTAEALNLLAGIEYREGDYRTASELVLESLAIYQQHGNRSRIGSTYSNLGLLASARQNLVAARDYYALSLSIHESLGNGLGVTVTRNNLALLERNHGNFQKAILHLALAAKTARNSDLNQLLAQVLSNLGQMQTVLGQMENALKTFNEAEGLCKNFEFDDLYCEVFWKRAECLIEMGDLQAAGKVGESALKLASDLESTDLTSEARRVLGRVLRRMGDLEAAENESRQAWESRMDSSDPIIKGRFAAEYGLVLRELNRIEEARKLFNEFVYSLELPEPETVRREISELDIVLKRV